jgi:hypothetical protein
LQFADGLLLFADGLLLFLQHFFGEVRLRCVVGFDFRVNVFE